MAKKLLSLLRGVWLVWPTHRILTHLAACFWVSSPRGGIMRIKFRTIGLAMGVLIMVLSMQPTAQADSFAFSFQGPTDSGSGTFFTNSIPDHGCGYAGIVGQCLYISSITGVFDGQPITGVLPLGDQWAAVTTTGLFETLTGLGFVVNTQYWDLSCTTLGGIPCLPGQTSLAQVTYYDPHPFFDFTTGAPESVTLTITRIPEPSTLLLLGIGLLCLVGLLKNKIG